MTNGRGAEGVGADTLDADERVTAGFDSVLFLSFGGPDGPDDVMPFLENVTRGRGVPRDRLEAVAKHYQHFGGVSPINRLNLDMIDALRAGLAARGRDLPVWFGNRNWNPMAEDTLADMYRAGHRRVLVFPTSAWGGYSGCRQYHEDIDRALRSLARLEPTSTASDSGVVLRKLPQYWAEPAFLDAGADAVRRAAASLPDATTRPRLVFTAHSVPMSADRSSGPPDDSGLYSRQVLASATAVAERLGYDEFDQVWQSRSGPPQVPWLEPDICDHLEDLAAQGVTQVIVYPIGFISDHLEVIWDLDNEAAELAAELGMGYARADTVGTDPRFVDMIIDMVDRYADGGGDTDAFGCGDNGSLCRPECCAPPARPARSGRPTAP